MNISNIQQMEWNSEATGHIPLFIFPFLLTGTLDIVFGEVDR